MQQLLQCQVARFAIFAMLTTPARSESRRNLVCCAFEYYEEYEELEYVQVHHGSTYVVLEDGPWYHGTLATIIVLEYEYSSTAVFCVFGIVN